MATTDHPGAVDLHCHSSASNGAAGKPPAIAEFYADHGYEAFGLTEHNNWNSLEAARAAADAAGIEYVPGVEITCQVDDDDLVRAETGSNETPTQDVLCFYYDQTPELEEVVDRAFNRTNEWIQTGLRRLREAEIVDIDEDELWALTRDRFGEDDEWKSPLDCVIPLGKALDQRGLVQDGERTNTAARRLLGEVYPPSELPSLPTATETSEAIRAAGGVAILAHPAGSSGEATPEEQARLERCLDGYVDGLEIFHPKNGSAYRSMLLDIAREHDCPFTGGSDRHSYGASQPMSDAPRECLDRLKAAAN